MYFYPRSPYGERRKSKRAINGLRHISIHALLTESDRERTSIKPIFSISIHALLTESDDDFEPSSTRKLTFLSTLSLRRATRAPNRHPYLHSISIHALLTESDAPPCNLMIQHKNFYPRSPYGERLFMSPIDVLTDSVFLSTLSLRRATQKHINGRTNHIISIHALLTESDELNSSWISSIKISIHALLTESDESAQDRPKG